MKHSVFTLLILAVFYTGASPAGAENGKENDFDIEHVEDQSGDNINNSSNDKVIIITADRIERAKKDISLSSSVVDSKQIEENQYTSLADLLESTPGFSRVYDYHSPLILRGSTGKKMLILRNGNPCFSSMPGGFMGQNVNVYDIDRVEVIRGPGSVMYGSGATCGIINIIGKDIFKDKGFSGGLGGLYGTNSNSKMVTGYTAMNNGFFALHLSGRYRKSDNMYYGDNEESLNSYHKDRDFSLKTGLKLNDNHRLTCSTSLHYGGPWGKPYLFNQKEQIMIRNEDDNLFHVAGKYEGTNLGIFKNIQCSIYYDRETREYHKQKMNSTLSTVNFDEIVNYENKVFGANAVAFVHLGNNIISIGSDGYCLKLWSPQKTIDYYSQSYPVETEKKDGAQGAGTTSVGVFAQDRVKLAGNVTFIAGIRYDRATVFEGDNPEGDEEIREDREAVSGNSGLIYNPSPFSAITLNAGRAFRMPSPFDMFTERVTCAGTLAPNPDLKPEYSWNFDIGYRGNYHGFEWDAALFSNIYTDLIVKVENPEAADEYMMDNSRRARIMGSELSLAWKIREFPDKGVSIKPGMTLACYRGDSFSDPGDSWKPWESGTLLTGIPPLKISSYIRFSYMNDAYNYFFEIENDTSFKKNRVPNELSQSTWNNEDVASYTLWHIKTGVKIFTVPGLGELSCNLKVLNLFDTRYYPFGSHIPGRGRDFRLFVSTVF